MTNEKKIELRTNDKNRKDDLIMLDLEEQTERPENIYYIYGLIIIYLILKLPFIILDLYFGFSNYKCLLIPSNIINLKIYLIVYGFIEFIITLLTFHIWIKIYYINVDDIEQYKRNSSMFKIFKLLFYIVWDLLGAIILWGYVNKSCNNFLSIYLNFKVLLNILNILNSIYKFKLSELD